jgi:hypothetical protein
LQFLLHCLFIYTFERRFTASVLFIRKKVDSASFMPEIKFAWSSDVGAMPVNRYTTLPSAISSRAVKKQSPLIFSKRALLACFRNEKGADAARIQFSST